MTHYFTNDNVRSNLKAHSIIVKNKSFKFYTDNGVFSKRKLDYGSRLLIESILDEDIKGDLLDVGCGYGVLGIILSSFFSDLKVTMIDVNRRCVHLSEINMKENNISGSVFYSNVYSNVSKKYDVIVTNPPIRAGKKIVYDILFESKNYLNKNGSLYFVINKNQGAKSTIADLSKIASIDILKKDKGFFVIKCKFD